MATDHLINYIVNVIGVPLPKYDYEYKKYVSSVPVNFQNGKVIGVEDIDLHDNFKDACLKIIKWHTKSFK